MDVRPGLDQTIENLRAKISESEEALSSEQTEAYYKAYRGLVVAALQDDRERIRLATEAEETDNLRKKTLATILIGGVMICYDWIKTASLLRFEETGAFRSAVGRMTTDVTSAIWNVFKSKV